MSSIKKTLGDLVKTYPGAGKIFHDHGLDFCCGGSRTLEQACAESHLNAEKIISEVEGGVNGGKQTIQWDSQTPEQLITHILKQYHEPLRQELPRLIELAKKVEAVHADKVHCPKGLSAHLEEIQTAVHSHLAKEEQILFPMILSGVGVGAQMPIRVMMMEHEDHGKNLKITRELTQDFAVPSDGCESWRELYRSLEKLEFDLMEHIHLENNILFPKVLSE
ncbi:MAG: iron-sulfur cluster repair protein YtfE [Deltaproteobacteria bacterium]|nr:iron-sulfur cluster repair protein YtfE [Deltaproteobacteria bacterium]